MKKLALFLLLLTAIPSIAQSELKIGYLSYESLLTSMPEYTQMQADMEQLRSQYEAEQKRVENDFNTKYESFLDGQASFPKTILKKRQNELQELLDKNIAFKKEGQRLLAEAEQKQLEPIRSKLNAAIAQVGQEGGYAVVINTDANAAPWMNPALGEDITEAVRAAMDDTLMVDE